MLPVNTKNARHQLRHDFLQGAWRSFPWNSDILAIECQKGWTGRNPKEKAMSAIVIYVQKKLSDAKLVECIKYLQNVCQRPFYAYHIVWTGLQINENRLPQQDTQDRFWLLNDLSYLKPDSWNYWIATNQGWGIYFVPTPDEIAKIYKDPSLFNQMLKGDYRYYIHTGQYLWVELIQKNFNNYKSYATLLQVHKLPDDYVTDDFYMAHHIALREKALNPDVVPTYSLPSI